MELVCGVFAVAVAGCRGGGGGVGAIDFDSHGWGGPNLAYALEDGGKTIRLESGMLTSRDFRWADSQFSFEFFDARGAVWGFRLLDTVFSSARHDALRNTRVRIGDKEFAPGKSLPLDQMWKFDTVLDVEFRADKSGGSYKVMDGEWYESVLENGKLGVRVSGSHDVTIRENAWNTFSARIVGGKLLYEINGRPGSGALQVDARVNGLFGIFVQEGGPLLICNLRLGAKKTP